MHWQKSKSFERCLLGSAQCYLIFPNDLAEAEQKQEFRTVSSLGHHVSASRNLMRLL